ncbi:branched-chain amino acid transport system permease protein [Kribbella pratensis]|uniref:Branched-chain amino acid transport system permease protein n=2 Tax=Kribbella TaxID=182639 RepID=A0ABY2FM34_9ACTN|nr:MULTISPECIES: branched-chain amino acid ABC transporter permease [Kribbella]TDW93847.1 branched-chain amino acid transport system permease protein [Kribbella pratensis]TDX02456.1 branched-chain amino acid transport system permease protein [Kribbella sp. VKM Ac-2566]
MDQFLQQLVNGLTLGSLYALIAVGYTVVYGIVQLINFAHGEVFMIGAFGALTTYLLFFNGETSVWILPVMIVGAMLASVSTAVLMERVAYRPLRNAPRLAPLITAIGISVFLQEFIRLFYERPAWTVVVFAGLAIAAGYVAGNRQTEANLDHPVSKWHDRAPLLGGAAGAVALWIVVLLISTDLSALYVVVAIVGGALVGTAVGMTAGEATKSHARVRVGVRAVAVSAGVAAVTAEVGWILFKVLINKVEWPSAKARIPFPQLDVVTGKALQVGGVTIQRSAIFTVAALAVCAVLLWFFINRTRLGRGMQAVSQDPDTARLMGINVDRIIVVAFALGAVLASIAGVSQGLQNNNIDFRMGFLAGLKAFTAAVLGGIGNVYGAVVGGLVLGVVEAMATQYIPGQFGGSTWKDVWAFVILILVLVFRPQGLLGARVVDRA